VVNQGLSHICLLQRNKSWQGQHLIEAANIGYGKTRGEVLTLVKRHVELKEDVSLRAARIIHGWWQKFKERNPSLTLRSGDSTAAISSK